MHKLPVFETAGRAYRFLLDNIATILRLSWLPLLGVAVVQYIAAHAQLATLRAALASGALPSTWMWTTLETAAGVIGTAIVAVALHRVILFGDHQPGRMAPVSFGRVEMLFAVLPIGLFLAVFVPILGFTPLMAAVPVLGVALALAGAVATVYVLVRLSPIFPITVVEGRYDFAQAWALSRGNVWRLIGLWLVVFIPPTLVAAVIGALFRLGARATLATANRTEAAMEQIESMLLVSVAVSFVFSIIFGALGVAMLSYAYKALNGRHPDDVLTRNA